MQLFAWFEFKNKNKLYEKDLEIKQTQPWGHSEKLRRRFVTKFITFRSETFVSYYSNGQTDITTNNFIQIGTKEQ